MEPPGVAVICTAATLSLAALELFVNLDPEILPPNLVSTAVMVPDGRRIEDVALDGLPVDWRDYPAPEPLQVIGADWVAEASTAVL